VELLLNTPSVSIVIPLYNKARHIARAIQSALNQTYSDYELVIVDDGSTDDGVKVTEAIRDPRIRLISQANAGVSAARNRGIAESRADLIAFLDADDEWLPGHLETIKRLSEKYPDCGAYSTAYRIVAPDGKRIVPVHDGIPASAWEGVIPNYFRSATTFPIWPSAVAIPRQVFDSVGLFPVGVARGEDVDMFCRIALRYPICFSTQVGAVYRKDADNRVCMTTRVLKEHGLVKVIRDALSTGVVPPGLRRDAFEFIAFCQLGVAGTNVFVGNPRYARQLLRSCLGTRRHACAWWRLMLLALLPPGWPARLRAVKHALRKLAARQR
jgi:glycosyltransferase involved in cell wall biosynthesis